MGTTKIKKLEKTINWGAKNREGKLMTFYDNCEDKIVPGLDKKTGILKTGLTQKEETALETKLGMEKGTLSKSSEYWNRFYISIPQDGRTFNTENPNDELMIAVLNADPTVAKSLEEVRTNPIAEYVMTSDSAEAKAKNNKRNTIAKAYATFAKLSQADTVDALFILGKDPSDLDFEVAQDRLGEFVESKPAKFLEVVGDKLFKDKVFFIKLIKAGIVKKHGTGTGTNMPLYYEDIMLGSNLEEAIAFIKAKENQQIALAIKGAYKIEASK